jgi:hypothetical protein
MRKKDQAISVKNFVPEALIMRGYFRLTAAQARSSMTFAPAILLAAHRVNYGPYRDAVRTATTLLAK